MTNLLEDIRSNLDSPRAFADYVNVRTAWTAVTTGDSVATIYPPDYPPQSMWGPLDDIGGDLEVEFCSCGNVSVVDVKGRDAVARLIAGEVLEWNEWLEEAAEHAGLDDSHDVDLFDVSPLLRLRHHRIPITPESVAAYEVARGMLHQHREERRRVMALARHDKDTHGGRSPSRAHARSRVQSVADGASADHFVDLVDLYIREVSS